MNNAELKRAIRDMADDMSASIMKLMGKMSLKELAALSGQKAPKAVAEAVEEPKKFRGKTKKAAAKKAAAESKKASKPSAKAKLVRRNGGLIERLRTESIRVLRESGDWMSAKAIGDAIGDATPDDLSFPINYLRARGLIEKQGDRAKAVYRISDAGKAFSGSFSDLRGKKGRSVPANDNSDSASIEEGPVVEEVVDQPEA
jgi:hypothetical protein